MIEYKGYLATFEFDPEIESFHGRVVNTRDTISFYGKSVAELKRELACSVESYLAHCAERGKEPEKPFSGSFLVRGSPELHRGVALEAARAGKSMNQWVVEVLGRTVGVA